MNTHNVNRSRPTCAKFAILTICLLAISAFGQAPPNPVPPETIPAGSLIIPMDNINQGDAAGTIFNLRAYGLANLLLQRSIPVKWAIKPGKSKDGSDFMVNVTRVAGTSGISGPATVTFSGGPFIVQSEYAASVLILIAAFNNEGEDVTVYQTNENANIDIRYTLTHKPKVAIGPDGGNFGAGVHQALFDSAGIGSQYYTTVTNDNLSHDRCYTLATQAHSLGSTFVGLYKNFVLSGGNLLLQCASISMFENDTNGHFQTTPDGYSLFGSNAPANDVNTVLIYPTGSMPFNQFIGILANQDGAVTEYGFAPGASGVYGHLVSVSNSGADAGKFVATVSQLNGPNVTGGVVFELGGHDYIRQNTNASLISRLNGQRMVLNALFVPPSRPECTPVAAGVSGYKSVKKVIPNNSGKIWPGSTVEWTIDYINSSQEDIPNFQVKDIIQPHLTLVPSSNVVLTSGPPTTAIANPGYTGSGIGSTSDLLLPGAFLPVNGRIQIKVRMVVKLDTPENTVCQTSSAPNLLPGSSLNSDNVDTTSTNIFGLPPPPQGSWPQDIRVDSIDPTSFPVPTAALASIEGSVGTSQGIGIVGAVVTVTHATTGNSIAVRTRSFGNYSVHGLRGGDLFRHGSAQIVRIPEWFRHPYLVR